ncbi:acyl carrier protein [Aspergillus undulatus]|uniref:acyl carrier protein n=1 Tax=Aspergillus undulatus TaxID=1810928 RepID=UPI003CCCB8E2
MRKILNEFVPGSSNAAQRGAINETIRELPSTQGTVLPVQAPTKAKTSQSDITSQVQQLLSSISGIEPAKIDRDAELADLGVDSLMAMELAREIEGLFNFSPEHNDLLEATTVDKLTSYISSSLPGSLVASTGIDNQASS